MNYKEKYSYNPIYSNKEKYFNILNFDRRSKRKYDFTYRDLRHTFTANIISKGTDIKIAQELLRHENYNITLSLYTHIDDSLKLGAVNDVFNKKSVKSMPKIKLIRYIKKHRVKTLRLQLKAVNSNGKVKYIIQLKIESWSKEKK